MHETPASAMRNGWFISHEGATEGPLSAEEIANRIREGRCDLRTRVRTGSGDGWRAIASVRSLVTLCDEMDLRPRLIDQRHEESILFTLVDATGSGEREPRSLPEGSGLIDLVEMGAVATPVVAELAPTPIRSGLISPELTHNPFARPIEHHSHADEAARGKQIGRTLGWLTPTLAIVGLVIVLSWVAIEQATSNPVEPPLEGAAVPIAPSASEIAAPSPPPKAAETPSPASAPRADPTPPPRADPMPPPRADSAPRSPARPVRARPRPKPRPKQPRKPSKIARPAAHRETPAAAPHATAPAAAPGDEVDAILDAMASPTPSPPASVETLPERLSPRQVMRVVRGQATHIGRCGREHEGPNGRLMVEFIIDPAGHVSRARVKSPQFINTPRAECVEAVIRGLRFPRCSGEPMRISIPFVL